MQIDFKALISGSPNPYVVLDRDLRLVWMNDAYLRATMRERESIIGKTMFEAFPSDPDSTSYQQLQASFDRVLSSGETDELALIRYDIARPEGGMETRYWSATHTPLKDDQGELAFILQHTVDVTELHGLRALREEVGLMRRADAVQTRNRDLAAEMDKLRALVDQAPGFVAIVSGPQHRFELANQAYFGLVGHRELIGRPVSEALPEVVGQGFIDLLDTVARTREPYVGRQLKVVLEGADGQRDDRFLDFIYQPIFGPGNSLSGIFIQGHDVTEQVEAQNRQRLLNNELNHRVKNSLALVQALAHQTFRNVEGAEAARENFEARLQALAAAHNLLTANSWEAAGLKATIMNSVEAATAGAADRFTIKGPDIRLKPQTAVSLALVIHELSTNATKYGALSNDEGRVSVVWTLDGDVNRPQISLRWMESGGPPVQSPTRQGFGMRLIERGIAADMDANVEMDFRPEGLLCSIVARVSKA